MNNLILPSEVADTNRSLGVAAEIARAKKDPCSPWELDRFLQDRFISCHWPTKSSNSTHSLQNLTLTTRTTFSMASRSFNRSLKAPLIRQLISPTIQRRTIVGLTSHSRISSPSATIYPAVVSRQQTRGVKSIDFAGHKETVYGT